MHESTSGQRDARAVRRESLPSLIHFTLRVRSKSASEERKQSMSMQSSFRCGPVALLFALLALTLTPLQAFAQISGAHPAPTQPHVLFPLGAWSLTGNANVQSGFLATTDNNPLELRVNNHRAMRF